MKMKYEKLFFVIASFVVAFVNFPVHAQVPQGKPQESQKVGVEEKLKQVYDLYRVGDVATLEQQQMFAVFGLTYAAGGRSLLPGVEESSRSITGAATLGYGLTRNVNLLATVPIIWSQNSIDTSTGFSKSESRFGVANPTFKLIAALPTRTLQTNAVFSVTPPIGSSEVSSDGWKTTIGGNVNWLSAPALVYAGLNWARDWGNDINALEYNIGVSLFINDRFAIGPDFSGSAILTSGSNLSEISISQGSQSSQGASAVREPDSAVASIRASYRVTSDLGLNTMFGTGISQQTPDVILGGSVVLSF